MKRISCILLILIVSGLMWNRVAAQTAEEWKSDLNILTGKIEQYHPMPWAKISKDVFFSRVGAVKDSLNHWQKEKIIVEFMKLVASLGDGHSEVLLNYQESFNRWFPVRMERFHDGIFITATDSSNQVLLGGRVVRIGKLDADKAFNLVSTITAKDSDFGSDRLTTNYLPNAVILKTLQITDSDLQMKLEVLLADSIRKEVILQSATWGMWNNWSWNKNSVPTNQTVKTIFDGRQDELPPYLSKVLPVRIPYWFEYFPDDSLLYFQYNAVSDWKKDPFRKFTTRLFQTLDEHVSGIDNFVIDVRFNEGGNGYLLPPLIHEFVLRGDSLKRCKIYIITGTHTFSAAPNFIGQMLRNTEAITVGEITAGPLNWCSDIMDFVLPNSTLRVNISTMFWQEGHPTDNRGYYPPDYYIPATFKDYISGFDPVLEAIKNESVRSLKEILLKDGSEKFLSEFNRREKLYGHAKNWFPYTSFDLILFAYFNLLPAGRSDDALKILQLNTVLYPTDFRAWYALAETYKDIGKPKEAIDAYEKLFSIEPDISETRNDYKELQKAVSGTP